MPQDLSNISDSRSTPPEIRRIFGDNLRALGRNYTSIAGLCRKLGINRTQYNRYLSGESFPRPDVLMRICEFFNVDARVLLEPISTLQQRGSDIFSHPEIASFLAGSAIRVGTETMPSGLYRFSRRSFLDDQQFLINFLRVYRMDGHTFLRGYEARAAMRLQGLEETGHAREFRGFIFRQEEGVAVIASRRGAMTCTFNFLTRVPAFENNYWAGYVTRTVPESHAGTRAERLVYEYLGDDTEAILKAARTIGFRREEELPAFHRRLLRPEASFT